MSKFISTLLVFQTEISSFKKIKIIKNKINIIFQSQLTRINNNEAYRF